jgi:cation:H+ antiporter
MDLALHIGLVIAGFFLLIRGAAFLIEGAVALCRRYYLAEITVGLTLVTFGTSLPEIAINISASYRGESAMVFANVIGSNIFNLFLVMGFLGFIYTIQLSSRTAWKEIPMLIAATVLLVVLANDVLVAEETVNTLTRSDGLILLGAFLLFMLYVFNNLHRKTNPVTTEAGEGEEEKISETKAMPLGKIVLLSMGGSIASALGGQLVIDQAVEIAEALEVSHKFISLTLLSSFTSFPEFTASAIALIRKKDQLAVGNIIGSSIFNLTLVLALSSFVSPLVYPKALNFDLNFLLFGTILLFLCMFTGTFRKLERWESSIFMFFFVAYVYFVLIRL